MQSTEADQLSDQLSVGLPRPISPEARLTHTSYIQFQTAGESPAQTISIFGQGMKARDAVARVLANNTVLLKGGQPRILRLMGWREEIQGPEGRLLSDHVFAVVRGVRRLSRGTFAQDLPPALRVRPSMFGGTDEPEVTPPAPRAPGPKKVSARIQRQRVATLLDRVRARQGQQS